MSLLSRTLTILAAGTLALSGTGAVQAQAAGGHDPAAAHAGHAAPHGDAVAGTPSHGVHADHSAHDCTARAARIEADIAAGERDGTLTPVGAARLREELADLVRRWDDLEARAQLPR